MLVLTMKKDDKVYIQSPCGNDTKLITVQFIEKSGSQVNIGFDAPKDIKIDREVVFKKKYPGVIKDGQ